MRPSNFSNLYSADGNKKLHVLWENGERIFCSGERHANAEHRSVLVVLPAAENPAPATVERLSHEYGLKVELDPAWAVRPLRLVLDGERTMLVLEDPGGRPLDRHLGRPMEVAQFLRLAINISAALRGLHERGIIHKDVKPTNILVDSAIEKVWLTGFGIASRLPRERQAPEPPETIAGTLAYMAPEQTGRMNRSIDSRSDLYAVGVSFYELLTGRPPFTAADPIELIHCHIAREPAPPGEVASGVPAPLSMIVMKLLAKTAEERYQTAAGVEADLRKCLAAWESFGRIDQFPLGLQDASERLIIPEKLYGRDGEIATLLAAFDRALMHGGSELVLVSGYSGIGKSSVVNELHKVIALPPGQLVILSIQDFVQTLRGGAGTGAPLDQAALEARVLRGGVPIVACFHWILQLRRHFLLGSAETALEFAAKAKPILWSARLNLQSIDYCFYHSLAIAAVFQTSSPERQAELREDFIAHLASFQRWAESCPATFAHKHLLVSAEWARLEGREVEAMRLYEQAIRLAAERGFLQDQALASELAARFYRLRGFEKLADFYLGEARDCHAPWGASAKVAQLDHSRHVGQLPPLSPKPTIEAPVERFDLATVIKMSEAVAGEIVLEKLIERLMVIAIEHAGADRGLLLLPHGGQHRIEAEARSGRDGVRVSLLETPVAPLELPVRILERVIRTQSQVILDDARGRNAFVGDDYIGRKQARSLLCLPLLKQAELTGVLYLENSLASHVFTPARIAVLKLLASQAAIALENARLYRDVAEREATIRRLVDANIIGVFISNGKDKIIEANDAFLRMLGYDRKDLALGRVRWTGLTAPEWRDRNSQMVEEVTATGTAQPHENEYLRKDGSRVPVLVGAASFEKTENQRVAFVLDLTERRRAEEALRELESDFAHMNRVSMLGELAASLSHEIAQPISSARNNARAAQNFLGMEPSDLGEVREALASVVADTDRVGEIIDRIREQIKKAPPRKERFDLNSAINEVVTLARNVTNRNGVLVETRLANRFSVVHGDRVQLQQVLLNLILNAVEAMGAVATGARELLISTEREPTGVLVAVRDSGPGIDPTHLERMFEAFYTTKSAGTGMGLSICRSIIDAHGGRLWAEANQPRGAVFLFTLPDAK